MEKGYQLLDSGHGRKFEQIGRYRLVRPASQAIWAPQLPDWRVADSSFSRRGKDEGWHPPIQDRWEVEIEEICFQLMTTDFGHVGFFPEQAPLWEWIRGHLDQKTTMLNLFAYSGGATLAAASAGARVCHLDASRGMVQWARENSALNGLETAPIRWIVDDVGKFVRREINRASHYDAIVLDPPTFGRGAKGEIFKIESDLLPLLLDCRQLLSKRPRFVLLSCHTPGYTPTILEHILTQVFEELGGEVASGELLLTGGEEVFSLPSGSFAIWRARG